jgi:hypothetical protein
MDMDSLRDTDAQSAKKQIKSLWIYLGVDMASLLPISGGFSAGCLSLP